MADPMTARPVPGEEGDAPEEGNAPEEDVEIVDEAEILADETAVRRAEWRRPSVARWGVFALLALVAVIVDQLSKAWVAGQLAPGAGMVVIPDLLNVVYGQNSGILFGLLPQSAPAFAIVSMGVTALIVVYHAKAGRGIVTTIALGLLLGGAIGNLLDRLNHGHVIDWVDMGIGSVRFWTYNVADACITTSIVLLIAMAVFPRIADWGADG
jgi:signal peptidase II